MARMLGPVGSDSFAADENNWGSLRCFTLGPAHAGKPSDYSIAASDGSSPPWRSHSWSRTCCRALLPACCVGAIYGLMCVGLALIFGVMRVINFAQGDFMMLGMYATYYFFVALGVQPLSATRSGPTSRHSWPARFCLSSATCSIRLLISRVSGTRTAQLEGEGHYAQLILTLGIALILENGGQIDLRLEPHSVRTPLSSSAWIIGPLWDDLVEIFVNQARAIAALLVTVVIGGASQC